MITLKRCRKQCVNDSCKLLQQRKLVSGGNYGFIPTHISTSRHVNCIQWAWHPRLCDFQTEEKETGNYNNNQNFSFHHIIQVYFAVFFMRVKGARKQKSNNIEKMSTSLLCPLIVIAIIRELAKRVTRSKHMDCISVSDRLDARL